MRSLAVAILALAVTPHAVAHHSDAGLDLDTTVAIEGVVTGYYWRNPHVYFTVATTPADGDAVEWRIQMTSVAALTRMGWDDATLRSGEHVAVTAFPAANGRPYGKFQTIARLDDGTRPEPIATTDSTPTANAQGLVATSLAGNWVTDDATVRRYPSRIDGLLQRQARLTERGLAGQAAYAEDSADNPQLRCLSRPPPAMILYSDLYPLQIDFDTDAMTVTMRSGYFDSVRTAYLDGRGHPPATERFYDGHAIGHWEGATLVIDSRNFADYQSLQSGIPFGAQKHLVERYTLAPDGRHMTVEFVLEDPEYLLEPITHRRELEFAPDVATPSFDCDTTSTTEFLDEQMVE